MITGPPRNVVIKFDLAKLEAEAARNKLSYWEYAWEKTLKGLDLSRLEMVELLSGDSAGTVIDGTELVYCVGFTYRNNDQLEYLKKHMTKVFQETESAICIEIDSKDPLPPEAKIVEGKLLDEDCDYSRDVERNCRELQKIYEKVNIQDTAYVTGIYAGFLLSEKAITLAEAQQILDNSIFYGMYTKRKIPILKVNFIMAALLFGILTVFSLIQLINGDETGFIISFAVASIIWTVALKNGIIMWLLKNYECVVVTVPKIEGVTQMYPEKHGKLYKLLRRGPKDFPVPLLGTFLPKKIIALQRSEEQEV